MTIFDVLRCSVNDIYSNIQMSIVPDEVFFPWVEELIKYTQSTEVIIYKDCDVGRRGSLCQLAVGVWLIDIDADYIDKAASEATLIAIFTQKLKKALHEHEG